MRRTQSEQMWSGLLPKADSGGSSCDVANVPFPGSCTAAKVALLDHLIGARAQRRWHVEAERLGGFEVEHHFEFGRRLHWQVGRLFALEDAIDVAGRLPVLVDPIRPVG